MPSSAAKISFNNADLPSSYPRNLHLKNTFLEIVPVNGVSVSRARTWSGSAAGGLDIYVPSCELKTYPSKKERSAATPETRASHPGRMVGSSSRSSSLETRVSQSDSRYGRKNSSVHEARTTIMVRNIPKKCSQKTLLVELDEAGFAMGYDFVYLPFCFETRANVGYAFINFITQEIADAFLLMWNNTKLSMCSKRALTATYADVQGQQANVKRLVGDYKIARIHNPRYQPAIFKNGVRVNFHQYTDSLANSSKCGQPSQPSQARQPSQPSQARQPSQPRQPIQPTPSTRPAEYINYGTQELDQVYGWREQQACGDLPYAYGRNHENPAFGFHTLARVYNPVATVLYPVCYFN